MSILYFRVGLSARQRSFLRLVCQMCLRLNHASQARTRKSLFLKAMIGAKSTLSAYKRHQPFHRTALLATFCRLCRQPKTASVPMVIKSLYSSLAKSLSTAILTLIALVVLSIKFLPGVSAAASLLNRASRELESRVSALMSISKRTSAVRAIISTESLTSASLPKLMESKKRL